MEKKTITELVHFQSLATDVQIVDAINNLNKFQGGLDGFLDSEISKEVNENSWCIIFHYENLEKVQAIGAKLRTSKEFEEFNSLIESESLKINFYHQQKTR